MPIKSITSLDEFHKIINSGKPVALDFWAIWCGPCRVISPVFEKLSETLELEGIEFYKVDVDAAPKISQEVGIRALPTFMVFKDGQKLGELVGANPGGLEALLKQHA